MDGKAPNTLPKQERLCGKKTIDRLLAKGRHGSVGQMRYIYAADNGEAFNRILVSVPKKLFRRAVKRNLLKRRIRESWRTLKHNLQCGHGMDILFIYSTKDIMTYQEIHSHVENIIKKLNGNRTKQNGNETAEI